MIRKLLTLGLSFALSVTGLAVPAQGSSSALEIVSQRLNYQGLDYNATAGTPLEAPGGSNVSIIINYRCSTASAQACVDPEMRVTLPQGVTIGVITYPLPAISGLSTSGSTQIFDFNNLNPGTAGQIEIPLTIQNWFHLDNAQLITSSEASTENRTSNISNASSYLNVRSGTTPRAVASKVSGGAVDSSTQYQVSSCLDPISGRGGLGVLAGATMVATLPIGAVYLNSSMPGLVYNAGNRTLTHTTTAAQNSTNCVIFNIEVSYPASDSNNTLGASKSVGFAWVGRFLGEISDSTLATDNVTHTLSAPVLGGSVSKTVNGTRTVGNTQSAATSDNVTYTISYANSDTQDWDAVSITDSIPDGIQVRELNLLNRGRGTATLSVKTNFGADGIANNADDAQLVAIGTLAAPVNNGTTSASYLNIYSSNFGGLGRPLSTGERITEIVFVTNNVSPGTLGYVVTMGARVQSTYQNNSLVTLGDIITNTANLDINASGSVLSRSSSVDLSVDAPVPLITVRNAASVSNLGVGVRTGSSTWSADASNYKVPNPRFVLVLPRFVTLSSWSSTDTSLPTPTVTTTENIDGAGSSKVLFSWPNGTDLAMGENWVVDLNYSFGFGSYGTMRSKGYVSSATIPSNCDSNYFGSGVDSVDLDADGDLSEVLCMWGADFTLANYASTQLTSYVKGSWDSAFAAAPAIGYTTPGSSDSVKAEMINTGTLSLKNVTLVNKLSKPGDTSTIAPTTRNPAIGTFPVTLRTRPSTPSGLLDGSNNAVPVVTYYSLQANPCLADLGYSAAGCSAAVWTNWDTTAPADIADITFLKFDFGDAIMAPGDQWEVAMGISTPSAGGAETDFAVVNPTTNAANDEKAYISFAAISTRADNNSALGAAESTAVALQMPSIYGPPIAPQATPQTTSGTQGSPVTYTITPPAGGTVKFWNGSAAVTTLSIAGEGTYSIVPATGVVTFTPLPSFSGQATSVAYQVENIFNLTANSTLAVTLAAAPQAPANPAPVAPQVMAPPVLPSTPAPLPVSVPVTPSQGVSVVNNVSVPVPVSPNPATNTVSVIQPSWSLGLRSLSPTGAPSRLDSQGRVVATTGLRLRSSGTGFAPNTSVNLFLTGTNEVVATVQTDASGAFAINVPVPAGLSAGVSHFQVAGVTPENLVRTTTLEIVVQRLQISTKVLFAGDSAVLSPSAKRILASMARRLQGVYGSISINSTGFVNRTSNTSYDTRLSRERARNAAEYLRRLGVNAKVTIKVFGIAPERGKPARRAEITATVN